MGQMKEDVKFKADGTCIYFCSHTSY